MFAEKRLKSIIVREIHLNSVLYIDLYILISYKFDKYGI